MKKEKKYSGVIIPTITPFTAEGEIDDRGLVKIIENMVENNSEALVFGTTGETASIPNAKKISSMKNIVSQLGGKTRIYAAVSDNSFEDAIYSANSYLDNGAEAVVVLLPGYYPIKENQMINYFEKFAEKVNGPMFLYNIPATTHISIPLEVVDKLSTHEKIVGFKDSERSMERLEKSVELWKDREDFSHFIGWGAQCLNGLFMGSDGIVPSTGNFDAKCYKDLYDAVLSNDMEKAQAAQDRSTEISLIYQKDRILSESLAALKVMMDEVGLCGTKVQLPFTQLDSDDEQNIRKATREIIEKFNLSWR